MLPIWIFCQNVRKFVINIVVDIQKFIYLCYCEISKIKTS